eukprot:1348225-Pleurochrysis_carterae.AAC.1
MSFENNDVTCDSASRAKISPNPPLRDCAMTKTSDIDETYGRISVGIDDIILKPIRTSILEVRKAADISDNEHFGAGGAKSAAVASVFARANRVIDKTKACGPFLVGAALFAREKGASVVYGLALQQSLSYNSGLLGALLGASSLTANGLSNFGVVRKQLGQTAAVPDGRKRSG